MHFFTEYTEKAAQNILQNKLRSMAASKSHSARSIAGQPANLYVETLIVTDESIFAKHMALSGSHDPNAIYEHMRIYYAHSINGVSFKI